MTYHDIIIMNFINSPILTKIIRTTVHQSIIESSITIIIVITITIIIMMIIIIKQTGRWGADSTDRQTDSLNKLRLTLTLTLTGSP